MLVKFFTKCCNLAKCLEEVMLNFIILMTDDDVLLFLLFKTVMTTAEERANDQSILREDFE